MSNDLIHVATPTWAARDLPARLEAKQTSKILGFAEHDIQILMAAGKLTPLGDPAPNAPKWFAAVEILRLAVDLEWLHKSTKEISKYWRHKRGRRHNLLPPARPTQRPTIKSRAGPVSLKPSPKPSVDAQLGSGSGPLRSGEQPTEKAA